VVTPANAGIAIEIFAKAMREGTRPLEKTMSAPRSIPTIEELTAKRPLTTASAPVKG